MPSRPKSDPSAEGPRSRAAADVAIVIPSLNPGENLPDYVRRLEEATGAPILLVDDGSRESLKHVFADCVAAAPNVTQVVHEVNKGKGRALKTAFSTLLESHPGLVGCVTCDSDGQHGVDDVVRCIEALRRSPEALVLGCRTFDLAQVPWKSRLGNKTTCWLFKMASGREITDTQTGLRAIPASFMRELLDCPGEGFEFETHMLLRIGERPLEQLPIETIYVNGNRETHFDPVRDSMRITGLLLREWTAKICRFTLVSILSFLVDVGLFKVLYSVVLADARTGRIFLSVGVARVVSMAFNYLCNRHLVFGGIHHAAPVARSLPRYLALAACLLGISYFLTRWAIVHVALAAAHPATAKALVDLALFLASYVVQRRYVFPAVSRG